MRKIYEGQVCDLDAKKLLSILKISHLTLLEFPYFIRTSFSSCLSPGLCPYIKTPRRYVRAENQAQAEIVTSINAIVTTISHQATTPRPIRTSINSEVKKGRYESTLIQVALGKAAPR